MNKKNQKELVKPDKPGGFLDYLPAKYLAREKMLRTIEKVFRSYGFDPIETPRVEFMKTLSGEQSDTGKNVFQIQSRHDKERLAMPFDHTVPFARLLAANPYNAKKRTGIQLPWRRMVVGPVFRGEKPQAGRFRQFYQFDVDIAGSDSMIADAEIVAIIYSTFKVLGIEKFLVRINNRKILNGLAEVAGIKDRGEAKAEDITKEMMRILDKLNKIGFKEVISELKKKPGSEHDETPNLTKTTIDKIKAYLEISGENQDRINQCQKIFKGVKVAEEGIDELRKILAYLEAMGIPSQFVSIDFSIARGLDYYTGPVFETILLEAPQYGSVFGGGRYNDLVKRFTGQELPATGVSLGVDRLFSALDHLNLIDQSSETVSEVLILRLNPDRDFKYLEMANEIRSQGVNTEVCLLDDTTFQSQFNYAVSRGVKFVVICGEDEFNKDIVQIKNLKTRQQKEIPRKKLKESFR